ncbi:MFS transporter [Puteibacter caeruleilacunae]|nr:MFS transporter [Puteibacter caeruleilacunae]
MGFVGTLKKFPKVFWASNILELFERWAWYGFYMAFALYMVGSKDTGALGFSNAEKGIIMGTGSMLLYFLPIFTGAIADKVGYKKILILSFTMYVTGYYMIGTFDTYAMVFFAFIWTCVGGAFFKPIISAMIARSTTEETSSIGFGIFYMMINVGGFVGPFIAGILLDKSWDFVFYMSMITIGINYLITFFFFNDPVEKDSSATLKNTIIGALKNIKTTVTDGKYVLFLLIMVLFWTAFNQLYYSFPVFADQWADTAIIYDQIHKIWPWLAESIGTSEGTISAVTLSSMDAFFIIVFQLMVSTLVMRYRPLNAMMGGIIVLAIGVGLMFATQNGLYLLLGILIFGLGEMASSPKFTEYIGRIAPDDKKAVYMGSSFLPIAVAHSLAGWLSGPIYEGMSDKIFLLKKEVAERGLQLPEISDSFSKNEYFSKAAELMGMNNGELTQFLWDKYQPSSIWMLFAGIAASATVLLYLYDKLLMTEKKKSREEIIVH